ncbi:hypothetical protein OHA79_43080 [Streptomyces sp. NBC_00841]|uniref:hypothetical protein n=1 Tax=Streptomyces sp. NBC_01669 TaxID=2975909 RepID=UPI002258C917|nr:MULTISPECIES: hypothetical protein [unclassified Streptomyces]MCX4530237.1 hypothetical protein [Streptomyces sp. NBC_01669]WSA03984.1 hypothetical protein OHA79_43080 [Streptomyces sp. NBC_00841]
MSGGMIIVDTPSPTGGRIVSVHRTGGDEVLGLAHSDRDVVAFLEGAGLSDPEEVLDDPRWVEWRGSPAHRWAPV